MTPATDTKATHAPILLDLGSKRRKQIKQLRKGTGKLLDEINSCIEELKTNGTISASAAPVILIVREKRRGTGMPGFIRC